jgi:hypothetical protein
MMLVREPGTNPMTPVGPLLLQCAAGVGDSISGDTPVQNLPLLLLLQVPLLLLSMLQRTGKFPLSARRSSPHLPAAAAATAVESDALVMPAPNSGGADSTCTKLPLLPLLQPAAAAGRRGLGLLVLLLAVVGCRSCCKPCAKKQNGRLQSPPESTISMQRQQLQMLSCSVRCGTTEAAATSYTRALHIACTQLPQNDKACVELLAMLLLLPLLPLLPLLLLPLLPLLLLLLLPLLPLLLLPLLPLLLPHLHLSPSEHSLVRKRAGCMWYSNTLWDWGHASPRGQEPCKSTAACHYPVCSQQQSSIIVGSNNCSTMQGSAW